MQTYYYNNHAKFSSEYISNARRITIQRYRCQLNKNSLEPEFIKTGIKRSFYFNKKGLLLEVIIYKDKSISRTVYTYNKKNKPICVFSFNVVSHQLEEIIFLYYDDKDRVTHEDTFGLSNYDDCVEDEDVYEHTYENDTHTIHFEDSVRLLLGNDEDYDNYTYKEQINNTGQVIEFKSCSRLKGFHLWFKYLYSNNGELKHEFDLNENGEVCSETIYEKDYRILKSNSTEDALVFESKFEYNNRGHWVKEYILKNGAINWVNERTIEYLND
jgi:hypothetical protein